MNPPKSILPATPHPLLPPLPKPTTTTSSSSSSSKTHKTPKPNSLPQDTLPSTLPLHTQNPHSIYRAIKRLLSHHKLSQALTILDHLYHNGVPVDAATFSALLSACARARSLPSARQVHAHLRTNGLDSNESLVPKLVRAYTACGSPDDARAVLSAAPASVYTWNGLLGGDVDRTVEVVGEMREKGVELDEYSYLCLVKSASASKSVVEGMKTHGLLIKGGFLSSSVVLQTSVVDMYFRCRKVRAAMKVFDEMTHRDLIGWSAVIAGFAHNRLNREALEYFRWMGREGIEPNSVLLVTILPVLADLSEPRLGKEIHGFTIRRLAGYAKLRFLHSGLIDMYCKCGDVVSARRVFYGSGRRNNVLWTAMMAGYASNGRFEHALRSFVWMQQEGVKADVVSIATVLPVCSKLKSVKSGKEIHAYALKMWILPNVSISTSLMVVYSTCGDLVYSKRVFDNMVKKNVVVWTAMADAYLKNDHPLDALDVFRTMQLWKHRADSITMARALTACGALRALKVGKEIHGQVLRRRMELLPFVSAETINMYGRCSEVGLAKRVFEQSSSKGSLTWTAIIDAYQFNHLYVDALDLFRRMQSEGFIPNLFTFDVLLSICRNVGLPDEALEIYEAMVGRYDLKASREHADCMIDILTTAGRTEELQRFIRLKSSLVV